MSFRRRIEALCASERGLSPEVLFFDNPAWDKPNGLSVLAARSFVTERTLLVMADQIAAPHLVCDMANLSAAGAATVLAVDRDLSRVFDFGRRYQGAPGRCPGQRDPVAMSRALAKDLAVHDAVSAGVFVMSPSLIACLDTLAASGPPSADRRGGRGCAARAGRGVRRGRGGVAGRGFGGHAPACGMAAAGLRR